MRTRRGVPKRGKKEVKGLTITEVKEDHPIIKKKVDKSLKLSVKEGSMASVSTGFGASYFGPFALFLGATATQISFLHGIASIIPSLTQLFSSHLIEKHSRKKITFISIISDIIFLGLMILLGFFYIFKQPNIWTLLILIGFFYIGLGLGRPAWFSWMGSLIPSSERGKYLSKRTKIASIFGLITMLLSALFLDYLKKLGIANGQEFIYTLSGFILFFALALVFRSISARLIAKQYEPRLIIRKKDRDGFCHFIKNSNKTALGKFSWFNFVFRVGMGISAPFYIIFLLKDYSFSYFWYMAFAVTGILFQIMFLPIMGKASDRFGNVALVRTCSLALALVPLIVASSVLIPSRIVMILFIITIPQMVSGFGWAGFNLATNNYIYDSTTPEKRGYAISNLNLLVGLGIFIGTMIASTLSSFHLGFLSVSLFAFLLSSALRLGIVIFGKKALQEVREVAPFSPAYFLHEIHPLRGAIGQMHQMNHQRTKIIHHI